MAKTPAEAKPELIPAYGDGVNWAGDPLLPVIPQLKDSVWQHYVFVREGNKGTFFVDGKVAGEGDVASKDPVVAATSNFRIGNWVLGGREFNGIVDEAFIFNRALNKDEVTGIKQRGIMKASPVFPAGKIATAWARIKTQY